MKPIEDKSLDFICIDLETTGTDPKQHSIIQIGAVYYEKGIPVKTFDKKMYTSGSKISVGALKVNKTPLSVIKGETEGRVSEYDALVEFVDFCLSIGKPLIILGHNVAFDVNFLKELFNTYGIQGFEDLFGYRVKDTAVIAQFLADAGVFTNFKSGLANLAETLGITVDKSNTHEALYDVHLTALCYVRMIERIKNINNGVDMRPQFSTISIG